MKAVRVMMSIRFLLEWLGRWPWYKGKWTDYVVVTGCRLSDSRESVELTLAPVIQGDEKTSDWPELHEGEEALEAVIELVDRETRIIIPRKG